MNHRPEPARIFKNAIVEMCHEDRFVHAKTGTNYIPILCDREGYQLRNEADSKQVILMTHEEIYTALDNGEASVEYAYHNVEISRLRALFGEKKFEDFPEDKRLRALHREKFINKYDQFCANRGSKPNWSTKETEAWLNETANQIMAEELDRVMALNKDKGRADTQETVVLHAVPSAKTFQREYKKYHAANEDILALVSRHHGPGQRLFKADPASIAFAVKEARGYLSRLRPTYSKVYRDYRAALLIANRERSVKLIAVSRKKLVNIILNFDEFEKILSRHGFKYAQRKFTKIRRTFDIQHPGQRVEIDHMKVDVITLLSEIGSWDTLPEWLRKTLEEAGEKHRRIHIVAAIDVATRYLLAFKATTNPKAASAVAALRMVMSDKRWLSSYVGAKTPWVGRIWPKVVYTDNGTEFTATRTEAVYRAAQVGYTRPAAGDPQRRPFIESVFHSVGPLLTSYFDGKTFASIAEKGDYNPAENISIDVDELVKVFLFAVLDVYHNRPHSGLGGDTPHNAWVRATQNYQIRFPPDAAGMARIFGVKTQRVLQTDGIVNFGITYNSDELTAFRRQHGHQEVEVIYDPECAEFVLFKSGQHWVPVKNTIGLDHTVTLYEWTAARKERMQRYAAQAAEGIEVMYEAIARIRAIGEAATMRANLSHVVPTDEDFEKLNKQVFGDWVASPVVVAPPLDPEMVIGFDPLRDGTVAAEPTRGSDSAVMERLFQVFGDPNEREAVAPAISSIDEDGWK